MKVLDHLDFVKVVAGDAQRAWRTTVLDKPRLGVQRDSRRVAGRDSQGDLFQPRPIHGSVECPSEELLTGAGAAPFGGNVHAPDEASVSFFRARLAADTNDAYQPPSRERAENDPLRRACKKRFDLSGRSALLVFEAGAEGGRAFSKCAESKVLKDAGVGGLQAAYFHGAETGSLASDPSGPVGGGLGRHRAALTSAMAEASAASIFGIAMASRACVISMQRLCRMGILAMTACPSGVL